MAKDSVTTPRRFLGNYELLGKVGEGGAGKVYKARHRHTGQIVAIKTLPPSLAENPIFQQRLAQEFRAASRLDHPHIVRALEHSEEDGVQFLVMEFVEGESLGNKLERGRLPEAEAIRLITQVCSGLQQAHEHGLIHRDIKPDNILVTPEGQAKLIDLGLVKELDSDLALTREGGGLGTPHFMAPEQFRGAKHVDVRCDIYSLGATLYMMVTGELPFASSNGPIDAWMKKINNDLLPPRKVVPTLSIRTERAIRRAMSADREERPASCPELLNELLHGTGSSSPPKPVAAPASDKAIAETKARTPLPTPLPRSQPEKRPTPSRAAEAAPSPPGATPAGNHFVEGLQLAGLVIAAMALALVGGLFLFHH
jgi:serine/threonine protein kinase